MKDIALANSILQDLQQKKRATAVAKIKQLIETNAELKQHWGGIARIAASINEAMLAEAAAYMYLGENPEHPGIVLQTAGIIAECGKIEQAIELVLTLNAIDGSFSHQHFLATAYSQIGQSDKAVNHAKKAIELSPQSASTWLLIASLTNAQDHPELVNKMTSLTDSFIGKDAQHDIPFWYALGKYNLDLNQVEQGVEMFEKGATLMQKLRRYDSQRDVAISNDLINHFSPEYFNDVEPLRNLSDKAPIFLIGLPRSGTTLTQHILSAHSAVAGGGELNALTMAVSSVGFDKVKALANVQEAEQQHIMANIRQQYMQLVSSRFGANALVVDKTLNLNRYLGVIAKVFPDAKIVHIDRDLQDTAWSCFRTYFNQGLEWSNDFSDIGRFFKVETNLNRYWQPFIKPQSQRIQYEALTQQPEAVIRSLLAYLELEFEPACLHSHQSKQVVTTASVQQVRQPINQNSVQSSQPVRDKMTDFTLHLV
ncbi:sulfotransferase [Thalassotalea aquiviva]|uniref:sulfotransferase n=1 Tax=Thalassotalea aquiviva TaxID=3242415 RepID=UPI00352A1ADD